MQKFTDERPDAPMDEMTLLRMTIPALGILMETQLHPAKHQKMSIDEREGLILSLRERARTHMLTCILNDALYNIEPVDPISALDDVSLLALDATMDRAIECLEKGIMLEDHNLLKTNRYLPQDH